MAVLRRFGELDIDEDTAALLGGHVGGHHRPAPGARRGKKQRAQGTLPHQAGLAAQKPNPGAHLGGLGRRGARGSSRSTWSATTAATPTGEHAFTLTVTDIATGWTENRSVRNKARKWVLAALDDIARGRAVPDPGRRFR